MGRQGRISKYDLPGIVAILLIHMHVMHSQVLNEISEFSYPMEQMPLLRKTRDVNTGIVEYIVVVEVNVTEVILFDQIKSSANSITPLQIDNITNINSLDITAVCQPLFNESQYQCTCENQYVWSYNNCITYNACDNLNEGTCTCISAIPSDGQVCVPKTASTTTVTTAGTTTVTSPNTTTVTSPSTTTETSASTTTTTTASITTQAQMNTSLIEYIVVVEVNVTEVILFDQIKSSANSITPLQIDYITNINSLDITAVCQPLFNESQYQCMCENQYVWSYNNCITYNACDNLNEGTCTCISAIPSDGQVCVPKTASTTPVTTAGTTTVTSAGTTPVTTAGTTTVTSASTTTETSPSTTTVTSPSTSTETSPNTTTVTSPSTSTETSPNTTTVTSPNTTTVTSPSTSTETSPNTTTVTSPSTSTETSPNTTTVTSPSTTTVTSPNTTTVTSPNTTTVTSPSTSTETSPNTTTVTSPSTTTVTSPNTTTVTSPNTTTVTSPNTTTVTSPSTSIVTSPNTTTVTSPNTTTVTSPSTTTVTSPNTTTVTSPSTSTVTSPNTTTVTSPNTTTVTSPSTTTVTSPNTTTVTSPNTTTVTSPSTTTVTSPSTTTVTSPSTTTPPTITPRPRVLSLSLKLNQDFESELNSKDSPLYQTYKNKIQSSIEQSYTKVLGYLPNSATVTGFRPGSVIADFSITSTTNNIDLASANQQLVSNLISSGFNVSGDLLSQSVEGNLTNIKGNIYPGTDLKLTCNPPEINGIKWILKGIQLQQSDKYVINNAELTVKNAGPTDSGQYSCITTINSLPYIIWQSITIQLYPNILMASNKIVQCEDTTVSLQCCVQGVYKVQWTDTTTCSSLTGTCITCNYIIDKQGCQNGVQTKQFKCQLTQPISDSSYNSKTIDIQVKNQEFSCSGDLVFGAGNEGAIQTAICDGNLVGYKVARCILKKWTIIEDNCVLIEIQNLKNEAQTLQQAAIPQFMAILSSNATSQAENIIDSAATITTIVDILTIVSGLSQTTVVSQTTMTDFIKTAEAIGTDGTSGTWEQINNNSATSNTSNLLLHATENIARKLPDGTSIITNFTSLEKKSITAPFNKTFGKNLTTNIYIPVNEAKTSLTVIISSAFNNILPVRNLTNNNSSQTGTMINGDVAVIETNSTINNISLSFDVINTTLGNPQCVFWNFNLLNGVGGWDSTGCQLKLLGNENKRYTCECNHTTSFSILMSPFTLDKDQSIILDYITYIGVGISMASLVLCLIIEIIIWKSVTRNDTSYMRHVSIVNIAVSLLIANICFIIGAAVVKQEGPCSTATFFMHFFYLALFFWMFLSALLLLYRTLVVFSRMTRGAMMAIGFTVGYGAPLIIAVITVASTAGGKGYIQQGYNCWLNWNKTKALLAFVIPALTIVAINLLVLIVVLCKMLRRGVNASVQPDEKHPLAVIARCVAILTPLFGLTWGFGIGTLVSPNFGIHVVFAFLNSLQGFFILLFGILLDSKVREALAGKFSLRNLSSGQTRSTSAGPTSSSGFPFMQWLRQRNVYNVQAAANSGNMASTSNNSYAPINT
ncbi:serine-rich adhesin for platelets-like isoform X2 [Tachysurus fulvidraco]|uniref:serine-rich adhesin for platelets-like isoform X2 n=1 Tax=Tachysurus fulvidraco TaxID=1234273 RepID=UPI001FED601C|nr:serine-rich adhesin for platelets-like isoform X2 [Tachysurus fulvidraco]